MDRRVTVRFYQVIHQGGGGQTFEDTLRATHAIDDHRRREVEVAEGCVVRLEELDEVGDLLVGDLTRVQSENLPSLPEDFGVSPLPVEGIGHHVAFCYDPTSRILAIQYNVRAVSPGRFSSYVSRRGNNGEFVVWPVLREGAWQNLQAQTPKSVTVAVARPENFAHAQGFGGGFEDQLIDMSRQYDAPKIEITLKARGRTGRLRQNETFALLHRFLGLSRETESVKKLQARTIESDDPINLLQEILKENRVLDLPPNDPNLGRQMRSRFVLECFDRHRQYLRDAFAPVGDDD